ncbi:MAG: 4-hydroxybutyryl-CoA dehydratase, partial [Deltaproteobacteria bacterium]|nr:4-hydroxybutyryl-CoA dehydratase [Deltaproteobacteria bacterium]
YDMALMPENEHIMIAISHITGSRINRFNHINQNIDDLVKKSILNRLFSGNNGSYFQRTLGMNTLNALSITTGDIDARYGTDYYVRFLNYLAYIQDNDLTCHGSVTDPRGNRYLPPHRQSHPDLLLHAIEETDDGIILQGTKACDIGALTSHELIIIPTTTMTERDESYALSFALPSDTKGITFVIGPESHNMTTPGDSIVNRAASAFQNHEALCIFDNVFVPRERIFMYTEYEFSEQIADLFKYSFCFEAS